MSDQHLEPPRLSSLSTEGRPGTGLAGSLLAAALFVSSLGLAAVEDEGGDGQKSSTVVQPSASASPASPEELLESLQEAPEANGSGYERSAFKHWVDADGNGCDTRQEVLIKESQTEPVLADDVRCRVTAGQWLSLYDSVTVTNPSSLDIDHMVPLKEAWESTASTWTSEQRQAYANDLDQPLALLAVTASTNRSKSDRDPAEWKPPDETSWCVYATAWTGVKLEWSLTADPGEIVSLREMFARC